MQLVLLALQPGEEALDAGEVVVAFEDFPAVAGAELAPGALERDLFAPGEAAELGLEVAVAGLGPGLDGVVAERAGLVGDDLVQVEVNGVAEALAAGAGAGRAVEAEEGRLGLGVAGSAAAALEAFAEAQPGLLPLGRAGKQFDEGFAVAFPVAELDRVH